MKKRTKYIKYLPWLGVVAVLVFVGGLAIFMSQLFDDEKVEKKKMVQQITVISPPPPPPPPPEIKEPEIQEEVMEQELDEALPDDGPEEVAGEDLGVDADGAAGSDGFGLVAKKGGRGFLGGGGYSSTIKTEINKALLRDKRLRSLEYEAIITLWVEDDGSFKRFEVSLSTGDELTETELVRFFDEMGGLSKPKPLEEKSNRFRFKIISVI